MQRTFNNLESLEKAITALEEGNREKKIVKILYEYVEDSEKSGLRFADVQPLRWVTGKNGSLQILTWDLVKDSWRRFEVKNIIASEVTSLDWVVDADTKVPRKSKDKEEQAKATVS